MIQVVDSQTVPGRQNKTRAPATTPRWSGLTVIDLFAGCGGLSLGLEEAGFTPVLFSELNRQAADTYLANREGMEIIEEADIYKLTNQKLDKHLQNLKRSGVKGIDLVCGGPPCQGFSGIGHRRTFQLDKKDIPSNHLFLEMIRVIKKVKPKIFLFENVKGLLNSRWTPDGEKGQIWKAVLTAFRKIPGYTVRWELVHAKNYGVPQNRPRVLMVGIRKDVLNAGRKKGIISRSEDRSTAIQSGFLPIGSNDAPSLEDLLSDLEDPEFEGKDGNPAYLKDPQSEIQIQLRTTREGKRMKKGDAVSEHEYSQHAEYIRKKFTHMIMHDGEIPLQFRTKKFAQRVFPMKWGAGGPNITATSLPEDYVHYREPRSPTVREWARLQTFPDWYVFKGPRTTGGRRRAGDPSKNIWDRDVPRYTQIGNAVPVLLAKKIGVHLSKILAG
jgi:DNA (cytosine-5)-methyltransferase 1